jgi:hypothetical protein
LLARRDRFGRSSILALATTCKYYAKGLYNEVRCARLAAAVVAWPSPGMVVQLKKNLDIRAGLVNGAHFVVLAVTGDLVDVQAILRRGDLAHLVLPRACFVSTFGSRGACRYSFPYRLQGLTRNWSHNSCSVEAAVHLFRLADDQIRNTLHSHMPYVLHSRVRQYRTRDRMLWQEM